MSVMVGKNADIYAASGSGTSFTAEACSLVSGTTYQIDATSKRYWDPTATFTVYDGATPLAASAYQLVYGTGKIILAAAPAGAVTVTGKYLSITQVAQGTEWTLNLGTDLAASETFGDSWKEHTATVKRGSVTFKRLYNADGVFFAGTTTTFLLALYPDFSTSARYVAIGKLGSQQITVPENGLIEESVSFDTSGVVDYAAS